MEEGAAFFIGVGASDSAVFMAEAFALFLAGLDAVLSDDDASDGFPSHFLLYKNKRRLQRYYQNWMTKLKKINR